MSRRFGTGFDHSGFDDNLFLIQEAAASGETVERWRKTF